jgi:hypothetical protein
MRRSRASVPGLQETATMPLHAGLGKRLALGAGAGARRVEHQRVIAVELWSERRAKEIAREGPGRLQPGRPARGLGKRREECLVGLVGIHRRLARESEGESAEACEKIGHTPRRSDALLHQVDENGFSLPRGLEEGACGKPHLDPGQIHGWRRKA